MKTGLASWALMGNWFCGLWLVSCVLAQIISSLRAERMPSDHSFLGSSSSSSRVFAHGRTFRNIRIWILKQSSLTESTVMLPIRSPRVSGRAWAQPGSAPDPWVCVLSIRPSFIAREL